jgi:K+-sensing histidine kinase KdpD
VAAAGLLLNFFLTEPLYSFSIAEQQNVITLAVMLLRWSDSRAAATSGERRTRSSGGTGGRAG